MKNTPVKSFWVILVDIQGFLAMNAGFLRPVDFEINERQIQM